MHLDLHVPRFTWPGAPASIGPTFASLARTAEAVGVRTGAIFGAYSYGDVLGARLLAVPPVIGFNWTLTLLGALLLGRRCPPRRPGPAWEEGGAAPAPRRDGRRRREALRA